MNWKNILVSIVFLCIVSSNVKAEELILGVIQSAPPLLFEDNSIKKKGIVPEIAFELSKLLSMKISVKKIPRKRIGSYLKNGKIDLYGFSNPNWFDVKNFGDWSIPISIDKNIIISKKKREINSYEELKGLRVGCRFGFIYSSQFMEMIKSGEIKRMDVVREIPNYENLLKNRIDVFVGSSIVVAQYYLSHIPKYKKELTISPLVISSHETFFAISKKSPVSADKLNSLFTQLKKDGTIKAIYAKYKVLNTE